MQRVTKKYMSKSKNIKSAKLNNLSKNSNILITTNFLDQKYQLNSSKDKDIVEYIPFEKLTYNSSKKDNSVSKTNNCQTSKVFRYPIKLTIKNKKKPDISKINLNSSSTNPAHKITSLENSIENIESECYTKPKLKEEFSVVYLNTPLRQSGLLTSKPSAAEIIKGTNNSISIPNSSKEKIKKIEITNNLTISNNIQKQIGNIDKNAGLYLSNSRDLINMNFSKITTNANLAINHNKKSEIKHNKSKPHLIEFIGNEVSKSKINIMYDKNKISNRNLFSDFKRTTDFSTKANSLAKEKKSINTKITARSIYIKRNAPLNLKLSQHKAQSNSNSQSKANDALVSNKSNIETQSKEKNQYLLSENRFYTKKEVEVTLFSDKKHKKIYIPPSIITTPKVIQKTTSRQTIPNLLQTSGFSVLTKSNSCSQNNSHIDKDFVINNYEKLMKKNEIEELKLAEEIFYLGNIPSLFDEISKNFSIRKENKSSRPQSGTVILTEQEQLLTNSKLEVANEVNVDEEIFDDENGNYIIKVGDHINFRYEIISELGRGSFGQALKCFDHKTNERVCIKIIKNRKKFKKQAKIEIEILQHIKSYVSENNNKIQPNIVTILDHFIFRNHICIVFEILDINLYELLKIQDFRGLEIPVIRKFSVQILHTLIFLQNYKIIHCDLKPENILLKQNGQNGIKVVDFGSSCFEEEKLYTYIQSRFYRAPEIILGIDYGMEIDMWSFGCIIAELFTGFPIFPGECEQDQLGFIMEFLGPPPQYLLEKSKKFHKFFSSDGEPLQISNSRGKIRMPNTKKISTFLRGSDPSFIDLVNKCLQWDPQKRIKPDEAMLHPWIASIEFQELLEHHRNNLKSKTNNSLIYNTEESRKVSETIINNNQNFTSTEASFAKFNSTPKSKRNYSIRYQKKESDSYKSIFTQTERKTKREIFKKPNQLKYYPDSQNARNFKSNINLILDLNINIKENEKKVIVKNFNSIGSKGRKNISFSK